MYPNGVTTNYGYDDGYRLTAMVSKNATGSVVDAWTYQYDAVGNRTARTDVNGKAETFRYDAVYRLTEANYGDGSAEKLSYDAVGNRLTLTNEVGMVTTYSYDVANQLIRTGTETFAYDANGNQTTRTAPVGTTTLTYDVNNLPTRLSGPAGTEDNKYGPNRERMHMAGASIENGNVYPQYDLSGNPVTDSDGAFGIWTHRLYVPGMDEPLAEWRRINNRITYLHRDALGSITAVSNTSGQVAYLSTYKAFGQMSRTSYDTFTTRLGYTSRESSVGGLMQYRSRYYDPSQGRFLQQDSHRGSELAPPSLHRYVYVHNNPVRYTDPTGMFINAFMATILVIGLAALYLGVHGDKVAHFWSGFAWTNGLVGLVLMIAPGLNTVAGIVLAVSISILLGTILEAGYFNAGGFDRLDWIAQNLGAMASCLLWLLILARVSPVAEMGSEMIAPLCYWSTFHMVFSVIVYHASESIARRFPVP